MCSLAERFERCAAQSTALVEAELGAELKQGTSTHEFPGPLIEALTQAYRGGSRAQG
jgi:hypothetical protein